MSLTWCCGAEAGLGMDPVKCWTQAGSGQPPEEQTRTAVTGALPCRWPRWAVAISSPTSTGVQQMSSGGFLCFCLTAFVYFWLLRIYLHNTLLLTLESMPCIFTFCVSLCILK